MDMMKFITDYMAKNGQSTFGNVGNYVVIEQNGDLKKCLRADIEAAEKLSDIVIK